MGFLYIVDYCRATSETDFWKHAVPGSLISAFVVFFPIERFPLVGSALCCLVSPCGTSRIDVSLPLDGIRDGIARGSRGSTSASHGAGIDDRAFVRRWNDLPHCDESTSLASASYTMLYILSLLADHHLDDYPSSWMPTEHLFLREGLRCPVGIGLLLSGMCRRCLGGGDCRCTAWRVYGQREHDVLCAQPVPWRSPCAVSAILGCGASRVPRVFSRNCPRVDGDTCVG